MPLINCEINIISTFAVTNSTGVGRFRIIDTKLYVPIVTFINSR